MASASAATCAVSIGHQLTIFIVVLSIVLFSPGHALPRPTVGALPTQFLFNELLTGPSAPIIEDNTFFNNEQVQQQQQPKQMSSFNYFVNKWPSLRDLLLTADYDDTSVVESVERERIPLGSRLLARLHQLGDNNERYVDEPLRFNTLDDMNPMPSKKLSEGLNRSAKQHNIKKNVQFRKQYMSPCHFKICNMGRKRNAGSYVPY